MSHGGGSKVAFVTLAKFRDEAPMNDEGADCAMRWEGGCAVMGLTTSIGASERPRAIGKTRQKLDNTILYHEHCLILGMVVLLCVNIVVVVF